MAEQPIAEQPIAEQPIAEQPTAERRTAEQPVAEHTELGFVRGTVAAIGASFIYALIRVFGRAVRSEDVPWLVGPLGSEYIGDTPYEECAQREGLDIERQAKTGGLIPRFAKLSGRTFDVDAVDPSVRRFYEETARYRMDMWAETAFPANIALWLLVTTISRKVNQLNFPLRVLDTAKGMDSEIVMLREKSGEVRYAGWYRRMTESRHVIYTGFYMTVTLPSGEEHVKVVFPMPNGNATVILRPTVGEGKSFVMSSEGKSFGDAGFYRVQQIVPGKLRVWRIRSLKEHFRVYVDDDGTLRCDHGISFLGLRVLHLHYRIEPKPEAA